LYIFKFEVFTTCCELHIGAQNNIYAQYVANIIFSESKRLEQKYGFFLETSELYKINHRTSNNVILDDEFTSLVQLALFYYDKTQGAFDVTLDGTIRLEQNQLIFSNDNTKIDFGGLVKEYAVDLAISTLKDYKITSALVNFGGDLASIGTFDEVPWNIGIEDPNDENINIATIQMNNNSLCTSGHSKRYKKIDNKKQSHIIVKEKNNYQQISVMSNTTVDAGVWCTALLSKPSLIIPSHIKVVKKV